MRTIEDDIKAAEERIIEMEKRRSYFANQYKITGERFYAKMAESETDMIAEVRNAIIEALVLFFLQ